MSLSARPIIAYLGLDEEIKIKKFKPYDSKDPFWENVTPKQYNDRIREIEKEFEETINEAIQNYNIDIKTFLEEIEYINDEIFAEEQINKENKENKK